MKTFVSPPLKSMDMSLGFFLFLMLLAYIFSVGVRLIWVFQFSGFEQFIWNDELMINTNDGYSFAEGARDILKGSHEVNDLSPVTAPLSQLTAFLARIVPVNFETLILYMPTYIGSLLVVPIMFFARLFNQESVGFIAALIGSVVVSYYNRTMTGYYDTDMLVVVIPFLVVCLAIDVLQSENNKFLFMAPVLVSCTILWHPAVLHVGNGLFVMVLFYMILFERKNKAFYQFLSIFIISLMTLDITIKLVLIGALNFLFVHFEKKLEVKVLIGIMFLAIFGYIVLGGHGWVMGILESGYFTRVVINEIAPGIAFNYFEVLNTVREAGHIPFETFAHRLSGSTIGFLLSFIGYCVFIYRYKLAILSLPMVILGFFALRGGLRFTVFAVPLMAIGIAYLIIVMAQYFQNFFGEKIRKVVYGVFIGIATMLMLYPNLEHIISYKVPTVFTKNEVQVLDTLNKVAQREDYVVAWWDYGYPIRYYSDVKTLIDGAKHGGEVNFPVSFALSKDQVSGANMARLNVEYTERPKGGGLDMMIQEYGEKEPIDFFNRLKEKNFTLPAKTRDIYFYLPDRMINIFPTVALFSTIDLTTGKQNKKPFFYPSNTIIEKGDKIDLGSGVLLDKNGSKVTIGNQVLDVNSFIITQYDSSGKLTKSIQKSNPLGSAFVIYMKNYNRFLVLDHEMFNSLFVQLYVLENYDPELFEATILTPLAKVYKLKR